MGSTVRSMTTIAICTLISLATFGFHIASASCAPPSIETEGWLDPPIEIQPGQEIEVLGIAWTSDCFDSCGVAVGSCTDRCSTPPQRPISDISISLRPSDGSAASIVADGIEANADLEFRVSITLPPNLRKGRYQLTAFGAGVGATEPLTLVIR
jgi:hypothetical protein